MSRISSPILMNVDRGLKPGVDFLPKIEILQLIHTDLDISSKDSLESRAATLQQYIDDVLDANICPDEITIERQFVDSKHKRTKENTLALCISYILIGILKQKYPRSRVRTVVPLLARERIGMTQYHRKQEMLRRGLKIIDEFPRWRDYVSSLDRQTDVCEALMMSIQATPVYYA